MEGTRSALLWLRLPVSHCARVSVKDVTTPSTRNSAVACRAVRSHYNLHILKLLRLRYFLRETCPADLCCVIYCIGSDGQSLGQPQHTEGNLCCPDRVQRDRFHRSSSSSSSGSNEVVTLQLDGQLATLADRVPSYGTGSHGAGKCAAVLEGFPLWAGSTALLLST